MLTGGAIAGIVVGSLAALGVLLAISAIITVLVFYKRVVGYVTSLLGDKFVSKENKEAIVATLKPVEGQYAGIAAGSSGRDKSNTGSNLSSATGDPDLAAGGKSKTGSKISSITGYPYQHCSPEVRAKLEEYSPKIGIARIARDKLKTGVDTYSNDIINKKLQGINLGNVKFVDKQDIIKLIKNSAKLGKYSDIYTHTAAEAITEHVGKLFEYIRRYTSGGSFFSISKSGVEECVIMRREFEVNIIELEIQGIIRKKIVGVNCDDIQKFSSDLVDFMLKELKICDIVFSHEKGKSVSKESFGSFIKDSYNMFDKMASYICAVEDCQKCEGEKKKLEEESLKGDKNPSL